LPGLEEQERSPALSTRSQRTTPSRPYRRRTCACFAEEIGIAPGIVVGRLQKEGLWDWSNGNRLKRRLRLSEA
jgi:HTH-type transcriptional regulator/antitoxin HigA